MNDELIKKTNAITAVITNIQDLPFEDQLTVIGMVYRLGVDMEKIAKKNKIKINDINDNDFSTFPKMQWGIRFDGKEQ